MNIINLLILILLLSLRFIYNDIDEEEFKFELILDLIL